ncbi:MAG: DNA repair protein RadC [Tissierellales bacterium]|nr:DNA repair protein RadC [Tissierellales bacterium]
MKEKYTIMEIPNDERPREKLLKYGAKSLTNSELIGILLRVGSNKDTAITLGQKILKENEKGLLNLVNATPDSLNKFHGVSNAKAATILAAVELGKRISSTKASESFKITSPQDVSALVMEDMRYYKKEYFKIILLDTKNKVIDIITISIGSLNSSIVHPREVFLEAVKKSSASIILLHNHPSGEVQPSREDINITQRLIEAGDIMGIKVLDHIIIGDGTYLSFKEENII